jgi:hypothetical protein
MQKPFLNTSDMVEAAGNHPPLRDKSLDTCANVIRDESDKVMMSEETKVNVQTKCFLYTVFENKTFPQLRIKK